MTAGVVDPAGEAQIAHPQQVPVLKAETPVQFGSTDSFQIPSDWLAGFAGADPQQTTGWEKPAVSELARTIMLAGPWPVTARAS